jgi:hypothetical protein
MGVKFQTICPPKYSECPESNASSTTMMIGAIKAVVTFSDKSNETIFNVIGDSTYVLTLSNHANPRAGIQIQYLTGCCRTSNYLVLLLVQAPP